MGRVTARRRARHLSGDAAVMRPETLAVEEPLEIRVNGKPIIGVIAWAVAKGLLDHDSWLAALVELWRRIRS